MAPRRAVLRRRSTCSTSPTGCTRPNAPGSERRRSTTSCRSTSRSGLPAAPAPMHTRKYENAARDVRRDVRELVVHRRRHRRHARLPTREDRRGPSRDRRRVHDGRPGRRAYAALPAHGRDARAAQEPRHAGRGLRAARRQRARARRRRRRRVGRAAAARPAGRRAPRARLRRGARAAVPRRRGCGLPLSLRGIRDADHRGDGMWHARRRLVASVARRGLGRRRRPLRPGESRGDDGGDTRGARPARGAPDARSRPREGLLMAAHGELFLEGYRRFS